MGIFSGLLGAIAGPLIGGLFGSRKTQATPQENLLSTAAGARAGSEAYGFNPLTLLQNGAAFGDARGAPAPLASVQAITGALNGVEDFLTSDRAKRDAKDRAQSDLESIEADTARSGVIAVGPAAAGTSPFRLNTPRVKVDGAAVPPLKFTLDPAASQPEAKSVQPGQRMGVNTTPGVFRLNNGWTGGQSIVIPGDSEPWGIDELATAVVVGAPQILHQQFQPVNKAYADAPEKRAKDAVPLEKKSAPLPGADWSARKRAKAQAEQQRWDKSKRRTFSLF